MVRQASSKIPPTMRNRMNELEVNTLQALEKKMHLSNGVIGRFLSTDKPSLLLLMRLLHTLGYECNSPEFQLINEIMQSKGLNKLEGSRNITSVETEGVK